jgi:hypothetical protein
MGKLRKIEIMIPDLSWNTSHLKVGDILNVIGEKRDEFLVQRGDERPCYVWKDYVKIVEENNE